MPKNTPKLTPEKARLVNTWQNELENRSGLVFGHMCGGKYFRKYAVLECKYCSGMAGRGYDDRSYDWHLTEEEYIIELLKQ